MWGRFGTVEGTRSAQHHPQRAPLTSRSSTPRPDRRDTTSWRHGEGDVGMLSSAPRIALALLCTAVFVPPMVAFAGKRRPGRAKPTPQRVPTPDAGLQGSRGAIEEHVHVRRGDSLGRLLAARG